MNHTGLPAAIVAILSVFLVQSAQAEAGTKMVFETGTEYFSGNYGTQIHTDTVYIPLTWKIQGRDWAVKATLPYLEMRGVGNVVNGIGQTPVATSNVRRTRSGLGDLTVAVTRNAYRGDASDFIVNLTGKIKFATTSSDRGLSTGENDYALESTLIQPFGRLSVFGTAGYKIYGSPAAYRLNNVFYGSLGGSYKLDQATSLGTLVMAGQKVMDGKSSRAGLLLFGSRALDKKWKIHGYLLKGYSSSVPDWGCGVLVDYSFEMDQKPMRAGFMSFSDA